MTVVLQICNVDNKFVLCHYICIENVKQSYIIYLPVDKDNKVLSSIISKTNNVTMMIIILHSHPIHDLNDNTNIDKYWVSSNSGTLYHLTCPKDAHIVLNRIVYVCPELTIVEPTQNDLCNDLERPCVAVQKLKQLRKEGEWVSHKNLIN